MKATQYPIPLQQSVSFNMADFIIAESNQEAAVFLENWPDTISAAAIIGPQACGKTHLGQAWIGDKNGTQIPVMAAIDTITPNSHILVDLDVSEGPSTADSAQWFFHLLNWTKETGSRLLIVARTPPTTWPVPLPDLKSRLATIHTCRIYQPDDDLLFSVLIKMFSDRQLQVDINVINYIIPRIERSFFAVSSLVDALDRISLSEKKKISQKMVKAVLEQVQ